MGRHDQLFKELLRTFFADFLGLVTAEAFQRFDPSRATFLDKEEFTDFPQGERRELDLVAVVPRRGRRARSVLVHVEIEAEARAGIGHRLWRYAQQLDLRHQLLSFSIVLFRRGGPPGIVWKTLRRQLGKKRDTFSYCSWGLSRSRAERYLSQSQPLGWALAALMRPATLTRPQHKMACLLRIARAPQLNTAQRHLLANFVETYLQLSAEDDMDYSILLDREENTDAAAMELTWADRVEARIQAKVEAEVTAKVEAEVTAKVEAEVTAKVEAEVTAKVEAEVTAKVKAEVAASFTERFRQVLLRQLTQRFGPLPAAARRRVQATSSADDLQRLGEQIFTASSLADLGLA